MRAVRTILSTALLITALSDCQNVADILEEVNNLTTSVNEFANGQPISSKIAPMSSGTSASITQSLNRAVPNRGAAPLFNDAKPAIANYIGLIACGASSGRLQRYSAPGTQSGNLALPHGNMEHHTGGCLRILRVNNIRKLAANALSFDVYYMSPQSEEVVRRTHRAIKQPDGEWLFNFYGW